MSDNRNPIELIDALVDANKRIHATLQDEYFDYFAINRRQEVERKLAAGAFGRLTEIHVGEHLHKCRPMAAGRRFVTLPPGFLHDPAFVPAPGSVVLLTNNDIGGDLPGYMGLYARCPQALFVIWDWDSQHWIRMSAMLAMHCDFYVAAASENTFLLSHFNPFVIGPVFCAAYQWSRELVANNFEVLLQPRSDQPYGPHGHYGDYLRRNRAIATVGQTFPSVGFSSNAYRDKSELDNLREWAGHKTHWIAPVLGGVPIRVYNALLTGGIAIVPSFYRNLPEIAAIGEFFVYYDVADLLTPQEVNRQAVARFDAEGPSGLIRRVAVALDRHHIDGRAELILDSVERAVTRIVAGDKAYDEGYLGSRC